MKKLDFKIEYFDELDIPYGLNSVAHYVLVGVVNHVGATVESGHDTATCCFQESNSWFWLSDDDSNSPRRADFGATTLCRCAARHRFVDRKSTVTACVLAETVFREAPAIGRCARPGSRGRTPRGLRSIRPPRADWFDAANEPRSRGGSDHETARRAFRRNAPTPRGSRATAAKDWLRACRDSGRSG